MHLTYGHEDNESNVSSNDKSHIEVNGRGDAVECREHND